MIDESKNGLVGGFVHEMSGFVGDLLSMLLLHYAICPVRGCGLGDYCSRCEIVAGENVLSHALVFWTVRSTAVCEEVVAGINGLGGYQERLFRS